MAASTNSNNLVLLQRSRSGLGLFLSPCMSPWGNSEAARVAGFSRDPAGFKGPAELSNQILIGDIICSVNGISVETASFAQTIQLLGNNLVAQYFLCVYRNYQIERFETTEPQVSLSYPHQNSVPVYSPRIIPDWDRPQGIPLVVDIGQTLVDRFSWLSARKQLWKAISLRNGHPWPSDRSEEFLAEEQEVVEVTPEFVSWLTSRKCFWREIATKRSSRKLERVRDFQQKEDVEVKRENEWEFNCWCSSVEVSNFDDGTAQWECPRCHRWAHAECIKSWYRATYFRRLSIDHYTQCFACAVLRAEEEGGPMPLLPCTEKIRTTKRQRSSDSTTRLSSTHCSIVNSSSSSTHQKGKAVYQCWLIADDFPDDVLVDCLRFLPTAGPMILLLVSMRWRSRLRKRCHLWQILCLDQASWKHRLPSRPRKPWSEVFLSELRRQYQARILQSDELLKKVWNLLRKGDNVVSVKKLVEEGELKFGFRLDHSSAVMLESNPLLNLAIIQKRHKTTRWLIIDRRVNVNICDKGGFSPLMDAAWIGDLSLTRLLLHFGADPATRGQSHFSGGIKLNGPILDAAGWAASRGHKEVAHFVIQWRDSSPEFVQTVSTRAVKEILAKRKAIVSSESSCDIATRETQEQAEDTL